MKGEITRSLSRTLRNLFCPLECLSQFVMLCTSDVVFGAAMPKYSHSKMHVSQFIN